MAYENNSGIGVFNQYGPRDTGGTVGVETDKDSVHQMSVYFTGDSLKQGFLSPFVVPVGAKVLRYILHVDQAFALSGTTPTVRFGSAGSIAANGVVLSKAELEAIGTKTPASTGAGTWSTSSATGITAAAEVAQDLGGTDPVVDAALGQATLLVEYVYKNRAVA